MFSVHLIWCIGWCNNMKQLNTVFCNCYGESNVYLVTVNKSLRIANFCVHLHTLAKHAHSGHNPGCNEHDSSHHSKLTQNDLFLFRRGGKTFPLNISFPNPWQVFKTVITSRICVRSTYHACVYPKKFTIHFF